MFMIRSRFNALALCIRATIQYEFVEAVVDGYKLAKKIVEFSSI